MVVRRVSGGGSGEENEYVEVVEVVLSVGG